MLHCQNIIALTVGFVKAIFFEKGIAKFEMLCYTLPCIPSIREEIFSKMNTKKSVDIIIFSGQSNMQGQTENITEFEAVDGAFEYRFLEGALVPMTRPAGENIRYDGTEGYPYSKTVPIKDWLAAHVAGGPCLNSSNMTLAFAKAYIAATGTDFVCTHVAKGSTEIKDWMPGTDGYAMIVKKAKAAIAAASEKYEVGKIFVAWLQGESDSLMSRSREYYKEKITELEASLRTDLGIDKFGIIKIGKFMRDERDVEIHSAQYEICAENEHFMMLTDVATELSDDPECLHPEMRGHFSVKGLSIIGRKAAEALANYRNSL